MMARLARPSATLACLLLSILLGMMLATGGAQAQTPVAAPTIDSVTPATAPSPSPGRRPPA